MKRVFLILLAVCIIPFSACSMKDPSIPSSNSTLTTVTVWTYYNGVSKDAFDSLVDEFNKTVGKEKNIIVEAYSQGDVNELADAVLRAANGDVGSENMPHIFAAYSDNAHRINKLGKIANLDTYFTEEEISEYRADFLADGYFTSDSHLKILPIAKSSEIMFINMTDYAKFSNETGVSVETLATWEGLADTAKRYYDWTDTKTPEPNDGKSLFGIDSLANFMLICTRQLGHDFYSFEGDKLTIDFPEDVAHKIWDNFYVPYISGHYSSIGRFRSDDAKTADILAYTASTAGASYFPIKIETNKDESYPVECGSLPYPVFADGRPTAISQGAGLVISKSDTVHESASAEFLKWFTEVEQNLTFAVLTGYLPVKNDALNLDLFMNKINEHKFSTENNPTIISSESAYKMLESYALYTAPPFENSYEARLFLEKSLITFAKADLEAINSGISEGKDRSALISEFSAEENFQNWYSTFVSTLNSLIVG